MISEDDYLKTELSSVESFSTTDSDSVPVSSSIIYNNIHSFNNLNYMNELELTILNRNESNIDPSKSFKLNLKNDLIKNFLIDELKSFNKIQFTNSYGDFEFNNDTSKNNNSFKSSVILSSDLFFHHYKNKIPRVTFILPLQIENSNKTVNEDSRSITFNYQNQYSSNRFFGSDLFDSSPRVVYGIENDISIFQQDISFNLNQSYEFKSNSSYNDLINQNTNFSDYSIESKAVYKNILFEVDARLDQKIFQKKR